MIEKRDLTHGGGWVPAVNYVDPKQTSATVPRLAEGTKYEFRVRAVNIIGQSEPLETDAPVVAKNQYGTLKIREMNKLKKGYSIFHLPYLNKSSSFIDLMHCFF